MSANTKHLSQADRQKVIVMSEKGESQVKIAKCLKCSRKAVQTALHRFAVTGSHQDLPKTGRPRKTNLRIERQMIRLSLRSRTKTSSELASDLNDTGIVTISAQTVRRRLADHGLRGCKARKKPWLSERNRKIRLQWAKNHKNWKPEDWAKVLWSDESNIQLFGTPGTTYVRRRRGEEYDPDCVVPTIKFGGGSVMIWGSMAVTGVGEMFACEGRMNSSTYTAMLSQVLMPSVRKVFDRKVQRTFLFQQDNAPCHTSAASRKYFQDQGICVLEWPPQSPDLNPIEHLWPMLKKNIAQHKPTSKRELILKIKEEWDKIPAEFCKKIIQNMPKRIEAVIKAKGGVTKY